MKNQRLEQSYKARNRLLRDLGFSSYGGYLGSALWRGIKDRVFADLGKICVICGERANQVHHLSYLRPVLIGEAIEPLVPLCTECHHYVEYDVDRKRNVVDSQFTFMRRIREAGKREWLTPDRRRFMWGYCVVCGSVARKRLNRCGKCKATAETKVLAWISGVDGSSPWIPPVRNVQAKCEKCGQAARKGYQICRKCSCGASRSKTGLTANCTKCPRRCKEGDTYCRWCKPRPIVPGTEVVLFTKELMELGRSREGGFSGRQRRTLGLTGAGKFSSLYGKVLTASAVRRYIALKDAHLS